MKIVINNSDVTTFFPNSDGEYVSEPLEDAEVLLHSCTKNIYAQLKERDGKFSVAGLKELLNNPDNFDSEHQRFFSIIVGYLLLMDMVIENGDDDQYYPFEREYIRIKEAMSLINLRQALAGEPMGATVQQLMEEDPLNGYVADLPHRDDFVIIEDFDFDSDLIHDLGFPEDRLPNVAFLFAAINDIGMLGAKINQESGKNELKHISYFDLIGFMFDKYVVDKRTAVWTTCITYLAFYTIAPYVGTSNLELDQVAREAKDILKDQ